MRIVGILLVLFGTVAGNVRTGWANQGLVKVIQLDDATINPVTAQYILKSIDEAESQEARCLIIEMDTPGGLLTSTRQICKKILAASIPVVVYIAPSGSRAGSAGVFITYASHIAAMAPSTNIGAAHPVELGGGSRWKRFTGDQPESPPQATKKDGMKILKGASKEEPSDKSAPPTSDENPMDDKILNDTVAFIKAMARERNRNVEWAVKSVTQSSSITDREALEQKVVEISAVDLDQLLTQLDGRTVKVLGQAVTLSTKDARVEFSKMNIREEILNVLANPNLAYLLLILGFYGLLYEITHPGAGAPGILGAIFLILAFFSMQTLPTNYAGVALIVLAIGLFIAEAHAPGWGILAFSGVISMILGSLLLFNSDTPTMRVSLSLIFALTGTTAFIMMFLGRSALRTRRLKVKGGEEGMMGETGTAETSVGPHHKGRVFVHGELWNAVSDETITKGESIVVVKVDGLTVKVKKA